MKRRTTRGFFSARLRESHRSTTILDLINLSLIPGYVLQAFKVAVLKPLFEKPHANYKPISNLSFVSKILEKAVANQLCVYPHRKGMFEDFQSGFRVRQHRDSTGYETIDCKVLLQSGTCHWE